MAGGNVAPRPTAVGTCNRQRLHRTDSRPAHVRPLAGVSGDAPSSVSPGPLGASWDFLTSLGPSQQVEGHFQVTSVLLERSVCPGQSIGHCDCHPEGCSSAATTPPLWGR